MSLSEVSKQMGISVAIIRELEADRIDPRYNFAYWYGYLRVYCSLLGLDHEEIVKAYRKDRKLESRKWHRRTRLRGRELSGEQAGINLRFQTPVLACASDPHFGNRLAQLHTVSQRTAGDRGGRSQKGTRNQSRGASSRLRRRKKKDGGLNLIFSQDTWVEVADASGKCPAGRRRFTCPGATRLWRGRGLLS